MTPNEKNFEMCERDWCPIYLKGKQSEEQTCPWFSDGYGGSDCFIKILASRAPKNPAIFIPSIDLDEFAEKARIYRERGRIKK